MIRSAFKGLLPDNAICFSIDPAFEKWMEERKIRIGLEVHQQLNTHKLFCGCPSTLSENVDFSLKRNLRMARSEMGDADQTGIFELMKDHVFHYKAPWESVCPVQIDESPPMDPSKEALDVALTTALLLDASPASEVHFMRKMVLDGSNVTGFQRTALMATGGRVPVGNSSIPIQSVCLEEDAARRVGKNEIGPVYNLDRQGIPLIEITTEPVIETGHQAKEVAIALGRLVRSTGRVNRGIGTIRQDVNVSVEGGGRVEIKGVQDLSLMEEIVANEIKRQEGLIRLSEHLKRINTSVGSWKCVERIFKSTKSAKMKNIMSEGALMAARFSGFRDVFGNRFSPTDDSLLGKELADQARSMGLGGIFHSDELPGCGIGQKEITDLRKVLDCAEEDGFVLVGGQRDTLTKACRLIEERALKAVEGVPGETRMARPDGTSRFMRPLSGEARMYPETDVPAIVITPLHLSHLKEKLPATWQERVMNLSESFGLHPQVAEQIVDKDLFELVRKVASPDPTRLGTVAAWFVLQFPTELDKSELGTQRLHDEDFLSELLLLHHQKRIPKEGLPMVARLAVRDMVSPEKALESSGLEIMTRKEAEEMVEKAIRKNMNVVRSQGEGAIGTIMGTLMKEANGRFDGKELYQMVKKHIAELKKAMKEKRSKDDQLFS